MNSETVKRIENPIFSYIVTRLNEERGMNDEKRRNRNLQR